MCGVCELANSPQLVKDMSGACCLARMGCRLFANITQEKKEELCHYLCRQGLTVIPHTSPHCLVRGKITSGLRMLGRGIRHCRIPVILLVAYWMKAPFPDMCLFSSFQPPPCSLLSRFDLGRYCHVPYIPIFGKVDDVSGNIYPILREFGGGYGSVELNYELPHTQTCKMKYYPKLVHCLKARNIGVDLPTTVKGYRDRVGALENMLLELNNDPGKYLCGFRFELAISGTLLSLMTCYDLVRRYRLDEEGVPENVIIIKRIPVDEYITFLTNALAEAKDAGLCHGRTSSTPSDVQKSLMEHTESHETNSIVIGCLINELQVIENCLKSALSNQYIIVFLHEHFK